MSEHIHQPIGELQSSYLHALVAGSGREADRVVTAALDLAVTPQQIYLDIFQPTAYQIGQLWQRNKVSVAQEHLATAIVERQMGEMHPMFRPKQPRSHTMVLGCVPDEWHRVGLRMVADFFEADGWDVHYLGANVPVKDLVGLARESHADLVGLSAEMIFNVPRVSEFVQALDQAGLSGIPIIAGGMPFIVQHDLAQALNLRGSAPNAEQAVRLAHEIVGTRSSPPSPLMLAATVLALRANSEKILAEALERSQVAGDTEIALIHAGYQYVLRMLDAALVAGSPELLDGQISWANDRQPHDGIAPEQLFERLIRMADTLRETLPSPHGAIAASYVDRLVAQQQVYLAG
ncbi:cobalamin B12-binding domain-containing protein [Candidatus Oscillochloris fontis]|uniref:cobalamin B12-binding domain-containing protein n=1 Tax=Candidatus Oscillochloris fontis TaxID=2496868 RepID=UPI0013756F09|nr:cobalamin-dependent protein [Candidatus Oscillochloris fontis]